MIEYTNQVMETRIQRKELSSCLQASADWLKEMEKKSNFFIEGVFLWSDTEYGDWCMNIYYTERIYK